MDVFGASVSPGGDNLAVWGVHPEHDALQVALYAPGTGDVTLLGPGRDPAWSHDGERLAVQRDDGIWVGGADGQNWRFVVDGTTPAWPRPWSDAGDALSFQDPDRRACLIDLDSGAVQVLGQAAYASPVAWGPIPKTLAFIDAQDQLVLVDTYTDRKHVYGPVSGGQSFAAFGWSPFDAMIAYTNWSTPGSLEIWVDAVTGGEARRVAVDANTQFAWSPDGTRIAYPELHDGSKRLAIVDLAIGGVIHRYDGLGDVTGVVWAP